MVSPYLAMGLITIVSVLAVLAGVGMLIYVIYNWIRNRTSPVVRVSAKVVSKRHKQHDVYRREDYDLDYSVMDRLIDAVSSSGAGELVDQTAECFLTFEANGRQIELLVPDSIYTTPEGTEGLLVYQGEIFRHFIPGVMRNRR